MVQRSKLHASNAGGLDLIPVLSGKYDPTCYTVWPKNKLNYFTKKKKNRDRGIKGSNIALAPLYLEPSAGNSAFMPYNNHNAIGVIMSPTSHMWEVRLSEGNDLSKVTRLQ